MVSPAEYWAFLGAAAILAVLFGMPKTSDGHGKGTNRQATGAFGTRRSSDEPRCSIGTTATKLLLRDRPAARFGCPLCPKATDWCAATKCRDGPIASLLHC